MIDIAKKDDRRGILSGVAAMGIATIIVKMLSVLYKIPMLNALGEEGMGYFNTAYTIYGFFYIVCTAGVPKAITILISDASERGEYRERDGILRSAFTLFFAIGLLLFLVFLTMSGIIARCIGSPKSVLSMIVIAPTLIIVSVTGVLRGYLSAVGRLGAISVSQILEGVFKLCLGLLLSRYSLQIGLDTPTCAAVAVVGVDLGALVAMLYMFIVYKKENKDYNIGQKISFGNFKRNSKSIFSISVPITLTSAVMSVSSIIDLLMIMSRLGSIGYSEDTCAGLFGNYTTLAVPMLNLCVSLIAPLSIAYLPRLTSYFSRGCESKYRSAFSSFYNITMLCAAFLFSVLHFFPRQVLYFIFGENGYLLGAELLSVLSVSVITYSALIVVNTALESRRCVRAPLISMLIGCIFKIPIEYFLLSRPEINIFGAAHSTNITYLIALLISVFLGVRSGVFKPVDAFLCIGYLASSVLSAEGALYVYRMLNWSAENRVQTLGILPFMLLLYIILSIFITTFGYLFIKSRRIAQKTVQNFI